MNGFHSLVNPYNTDFKRQIIASLYFDILVIPETHLLKNETIDLENYKLFHHNRPTLGNVRRGSGGIAVAIHNTVLTYHKVVSIVKGLDGQLAIKLVNNVNEFSVGILALYLPPDNYIYGRDPENFFNQAAALWEDLSDCDLLVGSGDVNSRTREIVDYIPDIDGSLIPHRYNPDLAKNSHADSFISFLKDNRSLILNGRVTPDLNNYTFVSPRGCSVPDYMFCPSDHLSVCTEMKTLLVSDIANIYTIQPPRTLPDHSVLQGTFVTSFYAKTHLLEFPSNFPSYVPTQNEGQLPKMKTKRIFFFKCQRISL